MKIVGNLVIAFLLGALSISGVSALDPFWSRPVLPLDLLPGTFGCRIGQVEHVITFNKDQSFVGTCGSNGLVTDEYQGKWATVAALSGEVTLIYTYSKSKVIAAGTVDKDLITNLDQEKLALKSFRGGAVRTWRRLVPQKNPVR